MGVASELSLPGHVRLGNARNMGPTAATFWNQLPTWLNELATKKLPNVRPVSRLATARRASIAGVEVDLGV